MWLACVALVALQVPESEPVPIVAPREWLVGSTLARIPHEDPVNEPLIVG